MDYQQSEVAEPIRIPQQDEIQDILGHPPGWLLRWGITTIAVAMVLVMMLGYIVKYPDKVEAAAVLTSSQPPIPVISKKNGRIAQMYISNNTTVDQGDLVARIESVLNPDHLGQLEGFLAMLDEIDDPLTYLDVRLLEDLDLGRLQAEFSALTQEVEDIQHYLREGAVFVKIRTLRSEIKQIERLNESISAQEGLLENELALQEKNANRHELLATDGVISDMENEAIQAAYLLKLQQMKSFRTTRITNDVQIEQLRTQINDLIADRRIGLNDRLLNLKRHVRSLRSDVATWRDEHLLVAPIDGQVAYTDVWSEDQSVQVGQPVFTIVPTDGQGALLARCYLPLLGSGKVKTGSRVNILLDAYPHQEYGVLASQVSNISLIPTPISDKEKGYVVEVALPDSLMTTYGKAIAFKQEMQGTAQIITEDRRILDRVFDKVLNVLRN